MTKRSVRIIIFVAAATFGGLLAWWLMPHWSDSRALAQIVSDDAAVRTVGWNRLSSMTAHDRTPRAGQLIDRISEQLADAGDGALLHAGDVLRPLDLWTWQVQPHELMLRELELRAASHEGDQQIVAIDMRECPLDAPTDRVRNIMRLLLESTDTAVRELAMHAMIAWAGRERAELLRELRAPEDDVALERLRRLAMSWGEVVVDWSLERAKQAQIDVLEAMMMQVVRATPTDAALIVELDRGWTEIPPPSFEYALRHSDDPAAVERLEWMAERGSNTARFALHARDPARDRELAERFARDTWQVAWRRRVAAWRMPSLDEELLDAVLAPSPADFDQTVYAVALLAERFGATDRAEAWMRDLDNDRKRAGILLAVLTGEHAELVAELAELPDDDRLRMTAQLALPAVTGGFADERARQRWRELAHRSLRKPDGDFDADVALCMMAAGETESLSLVTEPPRGDWRLSVQQRGFLAERFAPEWHDDAGRPVSGDARTIMLHFDWLFARWLLDSRRLRFDETERVYRVNPN